MKVFKEDDVGNKAIGTGNQGEIQATYQDLVRVLGEPTYSEASGDNKVQKEWVVEFEGDIFTIYDWKTYDEEYTMNELDEFNVGGRTYAGEFITALENKIKE